MTHKVRLYLVGCFILVSLAGCGRGFFQTAEREPWRREAEVACLKSGAVHETPNLVRIDPINGPGACGAEFPLKVAALNSGGPIGFADEMHPPRGVSNAQQPRWPISQPSQGPVSLSVSNINRLEDDKIELPRLGSAQGAPVASIGPVTIQPAATLACPIVSALEKWMNDSVQPAAMRWFGAPVVEIKQISAYSCRGMNGNPNGHISEHAFGNALDIAAFTLSDGRRISVKESWQGVAEEQGFLRDVQGTACQQFNTVLAPGSNIYHYDHIHVDLMRRASGRVICRPTAVSGEQVATRVSQRHAHAGSEPAVTGSIPRGLRWFFSRQPLSKDDEGTIEDESHIADRQR